MKTASKVRKQVSSLFSRAIFLTGIFYNINMHAGNYNIEQSKPSAVKSNPIKNKYSQTLVPYIQPKQVLEASPPPTTPTTPSNNNLDKLSLYLLANLYVKHYLTNTNMSDRKEASDEHGSLLQTEITKPAKNIINFEKYMDGVLQLQNQFHDLQDKIEEMQAKERIENKKVQNKLEIIQADQKIGIELVQNRIEVLHAEEKMVNKEVQDKLDNIQADQEIIIDAVQNIIEEIHAEDDVKHMIENRHAEETIRYEDHKHDEHVNLHPTHSKLSHGEGIPIEFNNVTNTACSNEAFLKRQEQKLSRHSTNQQARSRTIVEQDSKNCLLSATLNPVQIDKDSSPNDENNYFRQIPQHTNTHNIPLNNALVYDQNIETPIKHNKTQSYVAIKRQQESTNNHLLEPPNNTTNRTIADTHSNYHDNNNYHDMCRVHNKTAKFQFEHIQPCKDIDEESDESNTSDIESDTNRCSDDTPPNNAHLDLQNALHRNITRGTTDFNFKDQSKPIETNKRRNSLCADFLISKNNNPIASPRDTENPVKENLMAQNNDNKTQYKPFMHMRRNSLPAQITETINFSIQRLAENMKKESNTHPTQEENNEQVTMEKLRNNLIRQFSCEDRKRYFPDDEDQQRSSEYCQPDNKEQLKHATINNTEFTTHYNTPSHPTDNLQQNQVTEQYPQDYSYGSTHNNYLEKTSNNGEENSGRFSRRGRRNSYAPDTSKDADNHYHYQLNQTVRKRRSSVHSICLEDSQGFFHDKKANSHSNLVTLALTTGNHHLNQSNFPFWVHNHDNDEVHLYNIFTIRKDYFNIHLDDIIENITSDLERTGIIYGLNYESGYSYHLKYKYPGNLPISICAIFSRFLGDALNIKYNTLQVIKKIHEILLEQIPDRKDIIDLFVRNNMQYFK